MCLLQRQKDSFLFNNFFYNCKLEEFHVKCNNSVATRMQRNSTHCLQKIHSICYFIIIFVVFFSNRFWKMLVSLCFQHVLVVIILVCLVMEHVAVVKVLLCMGLINLKALLLGFARVFSKRLLDMKMTLHLELK